MTRKLLIERKLREIAGELHFNLKTIEETNLRIIQLGMIISEYKGSEFDKRIQEI